MRNFLKGIFGGSPPPEANMSFAAHSGEKATSITVPEPKPRDAAVREDEVVHLRRAAFRKMLNEYAGTTVNNIQFAVAEKALRGDGPFPQMTAEELRAAAKKISVDLFAANPEAAPTTSYNPSLDNYEKMTGARRKAFETAVMDYFNVTLRRSVTPEEMDAARAMFELDTELQQQWSTLVGEEVAAKARAIAERVTRYGVRAAGK